MQAFTINDNKFVEPKIRLEHTSRGYIVMVGGKVIPVSARDQDEIVLFEPDLHIHHVGIVEISSGILITVPFPRGIKESSPEEKKAAFLRFDQTALVLWKTRDYDCQIKESSAEVKIQDRGSLLIVFPPQSTISVEINHRNITLFWTGHEFMFL